MVSNIGEEEQKAAKFAELKRALLYEWPGLKPDTWVWCLHCERCFQFIDAKVGKFGVLDCAYAPDCDGAALDFWPWSRADWERKMHGQPRPSHWPDEPEPDKVYPLYEVD
jgi:hypothetical protein